MKLINAHTHLDNLDYDIPAIVNSTNPDDWNDVAEVCKTHKLLIAAYGIHPWYAHYDFDKNAAFDKLDRMLEKKATVGEIGLDKSACLPMDEQKRVFETQLEIAKTHKCVVTLHCYKAFDLLVPIIARYDLSYILHGYNASPQLTKSLLQFDTYFSFGKIQQNRVAKVATLAKIIPKERLLVETDSKPNVDLSEIGMSLCQMIGSSDFDLFYNNYCGIFGDGVG